MALKSQIKRGDFVASIMNKVNNLLHDHFQLLSICLLVIDFVACIFIINVVPYTEIDWETYMKQLSLIFDDGQMNYRKIEGPTGPLVYPAGHVYTYWLLRELTSKGVNIRTAQYIFAGLHTIALGLMLGIYKRSGNRIPLYIIPLLFISRRVMSLFVLRLFNDCVQSVFIYAALLSLSYNRWGIGCALYSLAVSIKMNALLYAPGLAVLLCQAVGFWRAILQYALGICFPIQLILALPFIREDAGAYLARAVELTRKFMYKWSVNGAFLPESIFTSSYLAIALLVAHLCTLLVLAHTKWTEPKSGGLFGLLQRSLKFSFTRRELHATHILLVLLSSNFVGIAFARTLHYQFYTWYVHSLPFLLWCGPFHSAIRIVTVLSVEVVFNVYPPHPTMASILNIAHLAVLVSLFCEKRPKHENIYASKHITGAISGKVE